MTGVLVYLGLMLVLSPMMVNTRRDLIDQGKSVPPEGLVIFAGPVAFAIVLLLWLALLLTCPRETLGLTPRGRT